MMVKVKQPATAEENVNPMRGGSSAVLQKVREDHSGQIVFSGRLHRNICQACGPSWRAMPTIQTKTASATNQQMHHIIAEHQLLARPSSRFCKGTGEHRTCKQFLIWGIRK